MTEKRLTDAQNAAWNTAGAIIYNLCLWAVGVAVVRLSPDFRAPGVLQLSMAVTNVFAVMSSYDLKMFLVSDMPGRYAVRDYLSAQLTAGLGALALCLVYALLFGYDGPTVLCVLAFMLYRALASRAEIYYAVEQKHRRMDFVGISFAVRGAAMLAAFALTLRLTGELLPAILAMGAVTAVWLVLYDRPHSARFERPEPGFSRENTLELLKTCLPAVLSTAMFTAVVTLPRQALETLSGTEALGIYASAAAPVVVLQVFATSVFDPSLRTAAERWNAGELTLLRKQLERMLLLLAAVTAAALAGAALIGRPALTLLYGPALGEYSGLLTAVVLCAGGYSACWLLSRMLIIFRTVKRLLVFTFDALAVSMGLSRMLVLRFGMNGVSFSVLAGYGVFFLLSLQYVSRRLRGEGEEDRA